MVRSKRGWLELYIYPSARLNPAGEGSFVAKLYESNKAVPLDKGG
jgi:hypothetical protein